jgi:predicted TPR repeat methyltransferase
MTREAESIRDYFERDAAAFDGLYAGAPWRAALNRRLRPSLYRRLELACALRRELDAPDVLDLGCGTGRTAIALCDTGAGSVHGIDFAASMIDRGRSIVDRTNHRDRITLGTADLMTWTPPRRWPLVIALGVLEYYRDPAPVLERIATFVDGAFAFTVRRFTPLRGTLRAIRYRLAGCPIHFATAGSIEQACRRAGFARVEIGDGGAGSYWVVART